MRQASLVALGVLLAVALVFGLVAAALAADLEHYWWHLGTVGSAGAILFLARVAGLSLRRALKVLLLGYAIGFFGLTIAQGAGMIGVQGFDWAGRVRLFFPEPNTLGAVIVVAILAILTLFRRLWWLVWPVAGLLGPFALVYTGSRTAFLALVAGVAMWLLFGELHYRVRRVAMVGTLLAVGGFAVLILVSLHQTAQWRESRNLLRSSQDFEKDFWIKHYADYVDVRSRVVHSPIPGYRADHVRGRSTDETPLLMYHRWVSADVDQDVPFVGSLYLRADEPQELVLRVTDGARVTCTVTNDWQRCVTPVGYGSSSHLRLETTKRGTVADFYAWGAQLEIGTEVSDLEIKRLPLISADVFRNLNPARWLTQFEDGTSARREVFEAAWLLFLLEPFGGHGLVTFRDQHLQHPKIELYSQIGHAHNLPLNMLAETGIFGFLSWAVPFFGVLALGWRRHWRRLLPLAVAILVLNTFDFTFYSNGVYYVYWLTVGLIIFGDVDKGSSARTVSVDSGPLPTGGRGT